jgi:GLPGLI family protein
MDAAAITKLLQMDAKSFEKELAKAFAKDIKAGGIKGELGVIGKEVSKVVSAWYCPSIPYSYGPNGHFGLPGLIFELEDVGVLFALKLIFLNK